MIFVLNQLVLIARVVFISSGLNSGNLLQNSDMHKAISDSLENRKKNDMQFCDVYCVEYHTQ